MRFAIPRTATPFFAFVTSNFSCEYCYQNSYLQTVEFYSKDFQVCFPFNEITSTKLFFTLISMKYSFTLFYTNSLDYHAFEYLFIHLSQMETQHIKGEC